MLTSGFDALKTPSLLDDHIQYVKKRESEIWVDTFAALAKYNRARKYTSLIVKEKN